MLDLHLVKTDRERSFFQRMDRILRRSLGVSETAPTDTTVKPAPPVSPVSPDDEELEFDDTHLQIDPELLGLKIGKPVLKDPSEWDVEQTGESEAQIPLGHDEL